MPYWNKGVICGVDQIGQGLIKKFQKELVGKPLVLLVDHATLALDGCKGELRLQEDEETSVDTWDFQDSPAGLTTWINDIR